MEEKENYYKFNYSIRFFSTCTGLCIVTSDFKKAMKENYEFFNKYLLILTYKKNILYESETLIFLITPVRWCVLRIHSSRRPLKFLNIFHSNSYGIRAMSCLFQHFNVFQTMFQQKKTKPILNYLNFVGNSTECDE